MIQSSLLNEQTIHLPATGSECHCFHLLLIFIRRLWQTTETDFHKSGRKDVRWDKKTYCLDPDKFKTVGPRSVINSWFNKRISEKTNSFFIHFVMADPCLFHFFDPFIPVRVKGQLASQHALGQRQVNSIHSQPIHVNIYVLKWIEMRSPFSWVLLSPLELFPFFFCLDWNSLTRHTGTPVACDLRCLCT